MAFRRTTLLKGCLRMICMLCFFFCVLILLNNSSATHFLIKRFKYVFKDRYLKWEDDVHETTNQFLSRSILTPHDYKYLHNVPRACVDRKVTLLMVTPSAPDNFERRSYVRRSEVGAYAKTHANDVSHLFFLGGAQQGSEVQKRVDAEARIFNDIVQEDFLDVYKNITLKAVSMLKWASLFCADSELVLRTDDDVTVDAEKVVSSLREVYNIHKHFILGKVETYRSPERELSNKYFVSKQEYAYEFLPTFVLGGIMGYPTSTVKLLYQASLRLRRFWLDDVYISGMCAYMVNATVLEAEDFRFIHGIQNSASLSLFLNFSHVRLVCLVSLALFL